MISTARMEKALIYLAESDEPCARALGLMEGLRKQLKTIEAMAFIEAEAPSAAAKTQIAYASTDYKLHVEKYQNAIADYHLYKNKRDTENTLIDVWRSLNASRRNG